jgi:hypothetical protein
MHDVENPVHVDPATHRTAVLLRFCYAHKKSKIWKGVESNVIWKKKKALIYEEKKST